MLLIDADAGSFDGATATVTIEDARRADAPAVAVAWVEIKGLAHRSGVADRIPFAINCADPVAGERYSVRASIGRLHSRERVAATAGGRPVLVRVQ
ncbi:hypothetical protein [Sphingomonas phyllosphaerae]|uniref:hypothetical protein n=1 Tax=Sphingomonas phyllosphaerae TaxID=257003 RepID=UPI000483E470|nr:hypothetical protein [Sphingomonas phyllosphaerae]